MERGTGTNWIVAGMLAGFMGATSLWANDDCLTKGKKQQITVKAFSTSTQYEDDGSQTLGCRITDRSGKEFRGEEEVCEWISQHQDRPFEVRILGQMICDVVGDELGDQRFDEQPEPYSFTGPYQGEYGADLKAKYHMVTIAPELNRNGIVVGYQRQLTSFVGYETNAYMATRDGKHMDGEKFEYSHMGLHINGQFFLLNPSFMSPIFGIGAGYETWQRKIDSDDSDNSAAPTFNYFAGILFTFFDHFGFEFRQNIRHYLGDGPKYRTDQKIQEESQSINSQLRLVLWF